MTGVLRDRAAGRDGTKPPLPALVLLATSVKVSVVALPTRESRRKSDNRRSVRLSSRA